MLGRRHLVVLGLYRNAQSPKLLIHIPHKGGNSLSNDTIIMVIQLLALCRHSAEKSSSGINQIFSSKVFFPVYQEILLLRTNGRLNGAAALISKKTEES